MMTMRGAVLTSTGSLSSLAASAGRPRESLSLGGSAQQRLNACNTLRSLDNYGLNYLL